ncbi:MAG TPA: HAMP domain-containing sensor histidine kinase [Enhygromyxa sp.]|nr:HAMP domain-containing sensor histidine kinase [Enhygromyxa sp.]
MFLAEYLAANRQRLIDRWKDLVVERLELGLEHSQLVDDLPWFLDELAAAARTPDSAGPNLECARSHGHHRHLQGVQIGSLTVELALVGEATVQLLREDGQPLAHQDIELLFQLIGRATAESVAAYVALRDKQLAEQAARHVAFIAHEIRNPLHNAKMAATLTDSGPPELRERNATRLQRALTQLSDLVDNVLVEARLAADLSLNVERSNVVELLTTVSDDVIAQAEARGQTITIDAQPFELDADRKLLLSALANLAKNAVKFTHDGGTIWLRASAADGRAMLEVADECGGMPEDLPARLFDPFVQVGADRSGFGLGLAIVKQAVDAHRGSIRVINRPGFGCTFVIDVPLYQAG